MKKDGKQGRDLYPGFDFTSDNQNRIDDSDVLPESSGQCNETNR